MRSTPMQWSYEGKKLDCAVKYLSWRPPWLEARDGDKEDSAVAYLGDNRTVPDRLGHGRIPAVWWTSNCAYNKAYEIHRLNLAGRSAREALLGPEDMYGSTRFDFVRSAPDIAIFMVSLRTELQMKMVMPSILPHSETEPFLSMSRFECGPNGNPHHHGFAFAAGNPRLGRVQADVGEGGGDLPPKTPEASSDEGSDAEGEQGGDGQETAEERGRGQGSLGASAREACAASGSEGSGGAAATVAGGAGASRQRSRGGEGILEARPSAELPENLQNKTKDVESQRQKEDEFWAYFGRLVSEWNPCFDDDGMCRYVWDEEVGAHDVEVAGGSGEDSLAQPAEPERVRLREVLDKVLADSELDKPQISSPPGAG